MTKYIAAFMNGLIVLFMCMLLCLFALGAVALVYVGFHVPNSAAAELAFGGALILAALAVVIYLVLSD